MSDQQQRDIAEASAAVSAALAKRDQVAAQLIADGCSYRQVAAWAEVSPQTVHNWVAASGVEIPGACPNGGPPHRRGVVGRRTCSACD